MPRVNVIFPDFSENSANGHGVCALYEMFKAEYFPQETILVEYTAEHSAKKERWVNMTVNIVSIQRLLDRWEDELVVYTNGAGLSALVDVVQENIIKAENIKKLVVVSPTASISPVVVADLVRRVAAFSVLVPSGLLAGRLGNNLPGDIFREQNFKNWMFPNGSRFVVNLPRALRVRLSSSEGHSVSLYTLKNILSIAVARDSTSSPPKKEWLINFNDIRSTAWLTTKNIETYKLQQFSWPQTRT